MSTFRKVVTTTADEEKQVRNGQDHVRVFDPDLYNINKEILQQLKAIRYHLSVMTGENYED